MSLVHINHHPNRQQLWTFGLCWLGFFALLASIAWWRHGATTAAIVLAAAAVVIPAAGAIWPPLLRWAFVGMSYATWPIGVVVSYTVLVSVYLLVITPCGWIMRWCGYDPLQRQWDPAAASYWIERDLPSSTDRYFRQY